MNWRDYINQKNQEEYEREEHLPPWYVVLGLLIYCAGMVYLFLFSSLLPLPTEADNFILPTLINVFRWTFGIIHAIAGVMALVALPLSILVDDKPEPL